MIKILLVEDDIALSYGVEYALKQEGFFVISCKNLLEAKIKCREEIDLIILDIMLPDGNGYDFCKEVRKNSEIPIIFMTALEEEANIVMGLDMGGDDYITKPVRVKELVSRINAVLRRKKSGILKQESSKIITKDLIVDTMKCKVWLKDKEVILTSIEYRLLLLFIENRGRVLTREKLLNQLWDTQGNFVEGNTLNVYIKRLREKVEPDIDDPRYIKTVRGIGYMWDEGMTGDGNNRK